MLQIRQQLKIEHEKPVLGTLKTQHSRRDVFIPESLLVLLLALQVRQRADRAAMGADWREMGADKMLVKPMQTRVLIQQIEKLMDKHAAKLSRLAGAAAPSDGVGKKAVAAKKAAVKKVAVKKTVAKKVVKSAAKKAVKKK